jgi:hypothetical protein
MYPIERPGNRHTRWSFRDHDDGALHGRVMHAVIGLAVGRVESPGEHITEADVTGIPDTGIAGGGVDETAGIRPVHGRARRDRDDLGREGEIDDGYIGECRGGSQTRSFAMKVGLRGRRNERGGEDHKRGKRHLTYGTEPFGQTH